MLLFGVQQTVGSDRANKILGSSFDRRALERYYSRRIENEYQLPRQLWPAFADVYTSRRASWRAHCSVHNRRKTQAHAGEGPALRMRNRSDGRRAGAFFSPFLHGGAPVHSVRYRGHLSLSMGPDLSRPESVWFCGDAGLHYDFTCRIYFPLEEGRARLALTPHPESDS